MILLLSSKSVPPTHTPLAAFLAHELPQSGPLESTLVLKAFPPAAKLGNQRECLSISQGQYTDRIREMGERAAKDAVFVLVL